MTGIARTAFGRAHVIAASVPLCGCERVPSVNVLGAYFPSWMLCTFGPKTRSRRVMPL